MPRLFPVEKFKDYSYPKLRLRNHYHDWVKACFDGETTRSNFAYAGPMTEMVLAGTIALRFPDQTLQWDAAGMSYTNVAEANNYVRRTYRAGWEVEGL